MIDNSFVSTKLHDRCASLRKLTKRRFKWDLSKENAVKELMDDSSEYAPVIVSEEEATVHEEAKGDVDM